MDRQNAVAKAAAAADRAAYLAGEVERYARGFDIHPKVPQFSAAAAAWADTARAYADIAAVLTEATTKQQEV